MEEERHSKSMCQPCPYMNQNPCMMQGMYMNPMMYQQQMQQPMGCPGMMGQMQQPMMDGMDQSMGYRTEIDEEDVPVIAYGHGGGHYGHGGGHLGHYGHGYYDGYPYYPYPYPYYPFYPPYPTLY